MKFSFLAEKILTIGLISILAAIEGTTLMQTAQAQSNEANTACSAAYFADPDYMYNLQFNPQGNRQKEFEKFNLDLARIERMNRNWAKSNTFSVALDAPVGYTLKKVNGKPITVSRKLAKEMYDAAFHANREPKATRRRVAELNRKYARYATFGQQINILFSPEQIKENTKMIRESNAYIASLLTPQQKLEQQESLKKDFGGSCPAISRPDRMNYVTLEVGQRPDLDKRLREDTTGATLFK